MRIAWNSIPTWLMILTVSFFRYSRWPVARYQFYSPPHWYWYSPKGSSWCFHWPKRSECFPEVHIPSFHFDPAGRNNSLNFNLDARWISIRPCINSSELYVAFELLGSRCNTLLASNVCVLVGQLYAAINYRCIRGRNNDRSGASRNTMNNLQWCDLACR